MSTEQTTPTFPQLTDLTPAEAASVAEGIIGLYATLGIDWFQGDWVQGEWDEDEASFTPLRACAMGAVRLMANQLGTDSATDSVVFEALFGRDALDDAGMSILVHSVIAGNDDGNSYTEAQLAHMFDPEQAMHLAKVADFGYTIGSTVRQHFNPGS